jgi:chromosome segregation ATPase
MLHVGFSLSIVILRARYAKEAAALSEALEGAAGGEAAHKRAVAALTKQTSTTQSKLEAAQAKHDELKEQHTDAEKALQKVQKYAKRIDAEMAKLDDLEGDEANKPIIAELRRLIGLNDALKQQEKGFKASCQAEMAWLETEIERMEVSCSHCMQAGTVARCLSTIHGVFSSSFYPTARDVAHVMTHPLSHAPTHARHAFQS